MAAQDVRSIPDAFPQSLDRLIGRESDLEAALGQFGGGQERLFTVLGPGGVGKTRFALELAGRLQGGFGDGGLWLECADLRSSGEVARQLSSRLRAAGAGSVLERTLRDRQLLLLLDNLEQIPAMGALISGWLHAAPQLCVLATSRRALRVPGERRFMLSPLERPPLGSSVSGTVILASSAVQLFIERARAVRPAYSPPPEHLPMLAQLCENLDGLPLALEIAASQMPLFELPALLAASAQPQTLSWTGEGRPPRQRSLEHSMSWSYALLEPPCQQLMGVLGLLRGSFLRETALGLGQRFYGPGPWADTLGELLDQNWLRREGDRFFMLESVRAFARRLHQQRPGQADAGAVLWEHYQDWTQQTLSGLNREQEQVVRGQLTLEWFNLRAVLAWATETGRHEQAVALLVSLFDWAFGTGRMTDVLILLESALQNRGPAGELTPRSTALALSRAGRASAELGRPQAQSYLERARSLARDQHDVLLEAYVLRELGSLHLQQGRLRQASSALEQACEAYQSLNRPSGMANCLWLLGKVSYAEQRFSAAETCFEEYYRLQRSAYENESRPMSKVGQALMLFARSMTRRALGDLPQALLSMQQALTLGRSLDHWRNVAYSHSHIGLIQLEMKRRESAAQTFAELEGLIDQHALVQEGNDFIYALTVFDLHEGQPDRARGRMFKVLEGLEACDAHESGAKVVMPLHFLAAAAAQEGNFEQSAVLLGAARHLYQGNLLPFDYDEHALLKRLEQDLKRELGGAITELLGQGAVRGHLFILAQMGLVLPSRLTLSPGPDPVLTTSLSRLSAREQSVLSGMAAGQTNRQIAAALELSQNTVRSYAVSLFNKLGCKTRAQAVMVANDLGWL